MVSQRVGLYRATFHFSQSLLSEEIRECHSPNVDTAPVSEMPRLIPNAPTVSKNTALCHTLHNNTHPDLTTVANKKRLQ